MAPQPPASTQEPTTPIVSFAAYAEPGSLTSGDVDRHPGRVIPLSFVGGATVSGAMRYLHDLFFG